MGLGSHRKNKGCCEPISEGEEETTFLDKRVDWIDSQNRSQL